jgi:CoA:oxalate CoA-transferase
MSGPLEGVRILALEHYLAGNHGSWLMSMFGAEVIKIERPDSGDVLRGVGPFVVNNGGSRSGGELRVMGNKKSVALDVATPDGRSIFFDLVHRSDVVWTNQKPSSLVKLGITFDSLRQANPTVVYATLSGFGHDDLLSAGPLAKVPAFDVIAQGLAGLQFRGAGVDGAPGYNGLALGDEFTSTLSVLGIILALFRREREGGAQRVDVAMHDSMVFLNELAVGMLSILGRVPPRGRSGTSAPYGSFRSSDGWVNIAIGGDPVWRRFCVALGYKEWINDPRCISSAARVENLGLVEQLVNQWTSTKTTQEIVELLGKFDVPCAAILDIPDVLDSEQVAARGMLAKIEDPVAGMVRIVGNPVKMNDLEEGVVAPPPFLGQDTRDVLSELAGRSEAEIRRLLDLGVIGVSDED